MKLLQLNINQIQIKQSIFKLNDHSHIGGDGYDALMQHSLTLFNQIHPLLLCRVNDEYHLLDGFLRISHLKPSHLDTIQCQVIAENRSVTDLFQLMLSLKYERIQKTLVSKIRFIVLLFNANISRAMMVSDFLPLLGFESHEKVLRQCERIMTLPEVVLAFCEEKHFAMRQCLSLTQLAPQLLKLVMSWRDQLNLSASIVEELASGLKDIMKIQSVEAETLIEQLGIGAVLGGILSSAEKTKAIRFLVRSQRYPILTQTNQQIKVIKNTLNLPRQCHIDWDQTLENKVVNISFMISRPEDWNMIKTELTQAETELGINKMLSYL